MEMAAAIAQVNKECSSKCSCQEDDFVFHGAAAFHLIAYSNTTIRLQAEVITPDSTSDSFYTWFDQPSKASPHVWHAPRTTSWHWRDIKNHAVTAGAHKWYIGAREDGAWVRALKIVSGDAALTTSETLAKTPWSQDWLDGGKTSFSRASCSARKAYWNKRCGVADVKTLFVDGEQGEPGPQGIPYKFTTTSVAPTAQGFSQPTTHTSFYKGEVYVKQGNYFVETRQTFERPVDVSVKVKQTDGGQECGLVQVFPQARTRHSGYNSFVGGWRSYLGAGVDNSISRAGASGTTSDWHTIRIWASDDGKVYFYLDGELRRTISHNSYQRGVIRFGYNCRNYQYKDLVVKGGVAVGHYKSRELTAGDCQARCKATKGCGTFSYWPSGNCHLQPNGATPSTAANVTAGAASCAEEALETSAVDDVVKEWYGAVAGGSPMAPSMAGSAIASSSGTLLGDEETASLQADAVDFEGQHTMEDGSAMLDDELPSAIMADEHLMADGSAMANAEMSGDDATTDVQHDNGDQGEMDVQYDNGDQGSAADGDQSSDGADTTPWSPTVDKPDPQPDVSDGVEGMPTGRDEEELGQVHGAATGQQVLLALAPGLISLQE